MDVADLLVHSYILHLLAGAFDPNLHFVTLGDRQKVVTDFLSTTLDQPRAFLT